MGDGSEALPTGGSELQKADWQLELLTERMAELELALEDQGWRRFRMDGER